MRSILKMTWMQVKLSSRVRIAFFFTFIFPMVFFFVYFGLFAKGRPEIVEMLFGPLISFVVISSSLFGLSVQLVVMRERDMLRRYHLAPISAAEMVMSRLLGNYLLFLPLIVLQYVLAVWMYHMPVRGSIFGLWLLFTLGYLALSGIGLVVAGIVNTMQDAQVFNQILFFILMFLSGTTIPLYELPKFVQHLSLIFPPTLMIVASEGMMVQGQPLSRHWPEIIGLAFTLVTSLGVAIALFRWEKEEKATRRSRIQAVLALIPLIVVGLWLNYSSSFRRQNRHLFQAPGRPFSAQKIAIQQAPKLHPHPPIKAHP